MSIPPAPKQGAVASPTQGINGGHQISKPIKRHLPFSSVKPAFLSPEDYHHFSTPSSAVAAVRDHEPEAIVVKSPLMKRNRAYDHNEVSSTEWTSNSGYNGMASSPFHTPVSVRGGRTTSRLKATKNNYTSAPPTTSVNASSPLTPASSCRYDSSLGLLTKKFINLIKQAEDGTLDLNKAADTLEVQKRRIYDITNVLEGIGLIEKKLKNQIQWKGVDSSGSEELENDASFLQAEVGELSIKEQRLNDRIREMHENLMNLSEDEDSRKHLYVTEEDIKNLPCFQNATLIAVKAPHGTTLEVPDPDEDVDCLQRRYRIVLRSVTGPIDVYLVSKFEKLDEMDGVEQSMSCPIASSSGSKGSSVTDTSSQEKMGPVMEAVSHDGHRTFDELVASPNYTGGMTKIVPENVHNDEDYWLLMDKGVSIADMWQSDVGIEWDGVNSFSEQLRMGDTGLSRPQTPPSDDPNLPHLPANNNNNAPSR